MLLRVSFVQLLAYLLFLDDDDDDAHGFIVVSVGLSGVVGVSGVIL
jgi:hypothetical protein